MPYTARMHTQVAAARPIGEMNTTPLVDVLLVPIVMLIIVISVATHTLEVPLPNGEGDLEVRDENTVHIDAQDRLYWNGHELGRQGLLNQLATAAKQPEPPVIRFEPDPLASYDRAAKTIALIKDAGTERFAFVGKEEYRHLEDAD